MYLVVMEFKVSALKAKVRAYGGFYIKGCRKNENGNSAKVKLSQIMPRGISV